MPVVFPLFGYSQFIKKHWAITGDISAGKYIPHVTNDKRIYGSSLKLQALYGTIGIGYAISDKVVIGLGLTFTKVTATASDTINKTIVPFEYTERYYTGRKKAPSLWAVHLLPVTKKIYFNSNLLFSFGKRKNKIVITGYKDTAPAPTIINYAEVSNREVDFEIAYTPAIALKIKECGLIGFTFTEISLRKDIDLIQSAPLKSNYSLLISPLKFGLSAILILPQTTNSKKQ